MTQEKQTTYWFIESPDVTINIRVLYETLKEMNLPVELVDFPDPDFPKDPFKRHYAVQVQFKLVKMINSKSIDLKGLVYHIWRKKGRDGKMEMVDHIFKHMLSAKTREAYKRIKEQRQKRYKNPAKKPPPPNLPKKY
jgi:predicted DNA-binding WGR domain protein